MIAKQTAIGRFIRRIAIGAIPLGCVLLGVLYYCFFVRPNLVGDLGMLGKIPFDKEYHKEMISPVFHDNLNIRYGKGEKLSPVMTIGDSFSQQSPNGYQNFLGHLLGDTVSNVSVELKQISPEQVLADMVNSGFFREHPEVKYVIEECVERYLISRWTNLEHRKVDSYPFIYRHDYASNNNTNSETLGKYLRQGIDWIKLSVGLDDSPVKHVKLSEKVFAIPGKEADLYFYYEDLRQLSATDDEIVTLVANLKDIHNRLAAQGVKFIFMPAPDKYELYQHLAIDNPFPPKVLGAQISAAIDTLDFVVNPREELFRRIEAGEKDLFMADDTHWSKKSASIAAEQLYERIKSTDDDEFSK